MAATQTAATVESCPRCFGRIEHTSRDAYCAECGLVVDENPIDYGPDWRDFGDGDNPKRAAPGNRNRRDNGLGNTRWRRFEGDQDEHRRNEVSKWVNSGSHKDRAKGYATGEIHRIGVNSGLPSDAIERAKYIFRTFHDSRSLEGLDMDAVAGACLYAVVRERQLGRTAEEIAEVARAETRPIRRTLWRLVDELGLELPPPSIEARLRVVAARVGAGQDGLSKAMQRLEQWEDRKGSPSVIAAACLWDAGVCQQNTAADAAGVSETGIRKRVNG